MILILPSILALITIFAVCDLISLLADDQRIMGRRFLKISEGLAIFLGPCFFLLSFDDGIKNDCCIDNVFFSPDYRLSIYSLIGACMVAYFYSSYRKSLAPPLLELVVTCLLLIGIVLNVLIAIHTDSAGLWLTGNVSIIAFFLSMLLQNHQLLRAEIVTWDFDRMNRVEKLTASFLRSGFFIKYPLILICCLPLLAILAAILFVFGQKPDSMVKAFTDTYKHGLSQLDYVCDNVQCGGHYLCSVAANGHKNIVKPVRAGERNGGKIICNRQLLISNAFEELIERRFPRTHRLIRGNYDKVGDMIHKNGDIFSSKYISDFIYVLMKPIEWIFLLVLYIAVKRPEDRIAQQYLNRSDRAAIGKFFLNKHFETQSTF